MAFHKAIDIANWFIFRTMESGDLITHLKVQKLLYFSEAWTQALLGKELFGEQIQAWAHGPVVPEVFHSFKVHGWNPLPAPEELPKIDEEVVHILNDVFETYGDLPAKTLENMTHADEPWIKARGGIAPEARCETVMRKHEIRDYFINKYEIKDEEVSEG